MTLTPPADNSSSEGLQVSTVDDFFKPLILLTENELYEKAGAYLFAEAPEGFTFESAAYSEDGYGALWTKGMDELSWRIRDFNEADEQLLTSVEDKENYDMSLYSVPLCESVPMELIQIVSNPIFRADELTQEAVKARAYKIDDAGGSAGYRMNFSVLYGDKLISVTSRGVSPEWLFHQLSVL